MRRIPLILLLACLCSGCWLAYWPIANVVYDKQCGEDRDRSKDTPERVDWCQRAKAPK